MMFVLYEVVFLAPPSPLTRSFLNQVESRILTAHPSLVSKNNCFKSNECEF